MFFNETALLNYEAFIYISHLHLIILGLQPWLSRYAALRVERW